MERREAGTREEWRGTKPGHTICSLSGTDSRGMNSEDPKAMTSISPEEASSLTGMACFGVDGFDAGHNDDSLVKISLDDRL